MSIVQSNFQRSTISDRKLSNLIILSEPDSLSTESLIKRLGYGNRRCCDGSRCFWNEYGWFRKG
ncbi:hypothetical protein Hanom_Chr02g00167401 [Helianthus anomalus]